MRHTSYETFRAADLARTTSSRWTGEPNSSACGNFFQLLTCANEPELKLQAESAYRVVKKLARPTRFERVTFAFGGQSPTNPAVHRRRKLLGWPVFG